MNKIFGECPVCKGEMVATRLNCEGCGTELTNQFSLNRYAFLSDEEQKFLETFLLEEGNFKAVQNKFGLSYQAAKKRFQKLLEKLNLEKEEEIMASSSFNPEINSESKKASDIVKKLLCQNNGKLIVFSQQGKEYLIKLSNDGERIITDALPQTDYELRVFDIIVELLTEQCGKARKGNARSGPIGKGDCDFNTVVGRIARDYFGKKQGDWASDPVMVMNAVLCHADICHFSSGGYMELSSTYKMLIA